MKQQTTLKPLPLTPDFMAWEARQSGEPAATAKVNLPFLRRPNQKVKE